jgi:Ca2+-transporting ATPase
MITGDHPKTAAVIAVELGIDPEGRAVTGAELASMAEDVLDETVRHVSVYARVNPEHKLRIVTALQREGMIVAMTGDGVNDAPSLKAAHIGIAMGGRGTDVAREASSIVLLDDDFGSVVKTIRLGRRIYDNLRKAMEFIFAVHVPIAGLALLPLLAGMPILLWPIHIAFLEMIIDPACSLAFEAEREEDNVMRRPPRPPSAPLFSRRLIGWSLLQGALVFALVAGLSIGALDREMPADEVRGLTFFSLVLAILSLIVVNRSFKPFGTFGLRHRNRTALVIVAGVAAGLSLPLFWSGVAHLFGFGPLHLDDLAVTVGGAGLVYALLESTKRLWGTRLWR